MKKIITILLCLLLTAAFAQQEQGSSAEKPQTLVLTSSSGLPACEILPAPLNAPQGNRAGFSFYYDRASFDAAFPGLPVEGFENSSIPPVAVAAIPHPLDQFSDNNFFNPGDILPGIQFWGSAPRGGQELAVVGANFMGNPSKTVVANYFEDSYRVVFNPPVSAAGMDIIDFTGNGWCTIELYDVNAVPITSDVSAASGAGVFWGVSSDEPIAEIRIISQGGGAEGVDNIAFGAAPPVPVSDYALLIGILLIVAFTVIRFRRII